MIANTVLELGRESLFLALPDAIDRCETFLKIEGLNPAGSIKLRPAIEMVSELERLGSIVPGKHTLVESSSGNLGVALSIVSKQRGYRFICVTDPNITARSHRLMQLFGAQVIVIDQRDRNGGYLGTRIDLIKDIVGSRRDHVWLNQYSNPANPEAHYKETAKQIHAQFPSLDYLVIGAGTTGTLMGCTRYFREHSPKTVIVAIDVDGSVTFGRNAKARHIPGLGTSLRPPILDETLIDRLEIVSERETILACQWLVDRYAVLAGGSTGSVIVGARRLANVASAGSRIVAISPDMGDAYNDTIYDPQWVSSKYADI